MKRTFSILFALTLVLAWFAFQADPPYAGANGGLAPTEDLLGWLLEQPESGP